MLLKLDLEKAYDRLEWHFINNTLRRLGVPTDLVDVIMLYVPLASFRVLWYGEAAYSFNYTKGLRRGNPLFPY